MPSAFAVRCATQGKIKINTTEPFHKKKEHDNCMPNTDTWLFSKDEDFSLGFSTRVTQLCRTNA